MIASTFRDSIAALYCCEQREDLRPRVRRGSRRGAGGGRRAPAWAPRPPARARAGSRGALLRGRRCRSLAARDSSAASFHIAAAADSSAAASAALPFRASDSARATDASPFASTSAGAPAAIARLRALAASPRSRARSAVSLGSGRPGRGSGRLGSAAGLAPGSGFETVSGTGAGTRAPVVSGGGIAAGGDGTAAAGTGFSVSPPRGRIQRMIAPAAASPTSTGRSHRAAPRVAAASCAAVPGRGSVCTGTVPPLGVVSMSSELMTSPAVCGRSAARFSRQRITSVASR